jgi:hypothetical protein
MQINYKIYKIEVAPNVLQDEKTSNWYYGGDGQISYADNRKILTEYDGNLYPTMEAAMSQIGEDDLWESNLTILPIIVR